MKTYRQFVSEGLFDGVVKFFSKNTEKQKMWNENKNHIKQCIFYIRDVEGNEYVRKYNSFLSLKLDMNNAFKKAGETMSNQSCEELFAYRFSDGVSRRIDEPYTYEKEASFRHAVLMAIGFNISHVGKDGLLYEKKLGLAGLQTGKRIPGVTCPESWAYAIKVMFPFKVV